MPRVLFRNRNDPDNPAEAVPGIAELPREYLDTSEIQPTGSTIVVNAGGDLQAAINAAQFGDQITIEAGATFTGPFSLPNKSGSGWVIIRTSTPDANLPPFGTRITPASAALLAKLVAPITEPVLSTAIGAHHYRFIGIEFALASGNNLNYSLIWLGESVQTQLSQVPHHLIFDRVYAHGSTTAYLQRVFGLNSASTAIINSYIADAHWNGADSQAIGGWSGPGPFKIVNNYLEGAGENVMFGGAEILIANASPSDIEFRRNHCFKPLSWNPAEPTYGGLHWTVKNLFELKHAKRVLIDGNVFDNHWVDAQTGVCILFQGLPSDSSFWAVVEDVTFTNNIVRNAPRGVGMCSRCIYPPAAGHPDVDHTMSRVSRIVFENNLFDNIGVGGNGWFFGVSGIETDVSFNHNTAFPTGAMLISGSDGSAVRFIFTNSIVLYSGTGVVGDGTSGSPPLTLSTYFQGAVVTGNVLIGGNAAVWPSGNFSPATVSAVGFVDYAGGDYHLSGASPYNNAGTDGLDIGADIDAINAATAGVV